MELQQVMQARRSMRQFDASRKVGTDEIRTLIEAAAHAPSWKNSQTARYYCVMGEEKLAQFRQDCLPAFNANNVKDAPALIVSTFVKNRSGYEKTGEPCNELGNGWGAYDLGLHNAYLILKAKEMGLDTLIMGIRDEAKIREMLAIDQGETVVAVIGVGYAAAEATMPKRKSVDEILQFV